MIPKLQLAIISSMFVKFFLEKNQKRNSKKKLIEVKYPIPVIKDSVDRQPGPIRVRSSGYVWR